MLMQHNTTQNQKNHPEEPPATTPKRQYNPQSNRIPDTAAVIPLDMARHVLDLIQSAAQLDDSEADQTGVETEGSAHVDLGLRRGVESHDKVVAVGVFGLVLCCRLGQAKCAPVGEAADHAAGPEDRGPGRTGDSGHVRYKKLT